MNERFNNIDFRVEISNITSIIFLQRPKLTCTIVSYVLQQRNEEYSVYE